MKKTLIIGWFGDRKVCSNTVHHQCGETKFLCANDNVGYVMNDLMEKYPKINRWTIEPNIDESFIREEYFYISIAKDANKKFKLNKGIYDHMWSKFK